MTATITAAALADAINTRTVRVLVDVHSRGGLIPARRKTGVQTLAVTAVKSRLVAPDGTYVRRSTRVYEIQTSAGTVSVYPAQTFWFAPEDAAAVKRAHVEALAEDAERTAAAPAVEPVAVEVPAAAPAAEQADGDELDSLTFAQLMEIAKQLKVKGRGTARIGALREGIRAARKAA